MKAKPRSRLWTFELKVITDFVLGADVATPGPVVEECASSSQSSCIDDFEVVGDAETEGFADFEIVD